MRDLFGEKPTRLSVKKGHTVEAKGAEGEHLVQALRATDWVGGGPHGASTTLGVKRTKLVDKMPALVFHGLGADGCLSAFCQRSCHPWLRLSSI
jgi:hypothetical protein